MSTEWEDDTDADRDAREFEGGITWRGVVALLIVCATVAMIYIFAEPSGQ